MRASILPFLVFHTIPDFNLNWLVRNLLKHDL